MPLHFSIMSPHKTEVYYLEYIQFAVSKTGNMEEIPLDQDVEKQFLVCINSQIA